MSGKPGAGKSTLMKYLCSHDKVEEYLKIWAGEKGLPFSKFFFWKPGTELQKSLKGLMRALLHSILTQLPGMIELILPKHWEASQAHQAVHFEHADIQAAFDSFIVRPDVYEKHKFVFFIDGLDEFNGDHDGMIKSFFRWVSASSNNVKICVSSREELVFLERFSDCPKLRLHDLTKEDMEVFIEQTLKDNTDFQDRQDQVEILRLAKTITYRAEGVFLWASLAVQSVTSGLLTEDDVEDLEQRIDALPTALEDLVQAIFDSIQNRSSVDRVAALRSLAYVLYLTELNTSPNMVPLLHFATLAEFGSKRSSSPQSCGHEQVARKLRRARKQIYFRCNGLLHVTSGGTGFRQQRVTFIHRAITEFLEKECPHSQMMKAMESFDVAGFFFHALVFELDNCGPQGYGSESESGLYYSPDKDSGLCMDMNALIRLHLAHNRSEPAKLFKMLDTISAHVEKSILDGLHGSYGMYSRPLDSPRFACFQCRPFEMVCVVVARWGLLEYYQERVEYAPASGHKTALHPDNALCIVIEPLFGNGVFSEGQLRVLLFCLEKGSDNKDEIFAAFWGIYLWQSLLIRPGLELVMRIFLVYGASPEFHLRFEPDHDDKGYQGLIKVHGQFALSPCNPIYIRDSPRGIIQYARKNGWVVSFRELVSFWYPS